MKRKRIPPADCKVGAERELLDIIGQSIGLQQAGTDWRGGEHAPWPHKCNFIYQLPVEGNCESGSGCEAPGRLGCSPQRAEAAGGSNPAAIPRSAPAPRGSAAGAVSRAVLAAVGARGWGGG